MQKIKKIRYNFLLFKNRQHDKNEVFESIRARASGSVRYTCGYRIYTHTHIAASIYIYIYASDYNIYDWIAAATL